MPKLPWPQPPDDGSPRHRLNVDVSIRDHNTIRVVIPDYGFISLAIQTFHHDLAEYIRSHGYTYADYDTVIAYIRNRADSRAAGDSSQRAERSPATGVHPNSPSTPDLQSSHAETAKNRQRGEKIREVYKERRQRQKGQTAS